MSSNTLFGGQTRFDALLEIYAAERPDLLVLQEGVDWCDRQLAAIAEAIEVPFDRDHTLLAHASLRPSGRRFHLAIVSRPTLHAATFHNDGFGHALIEATFTAHPRGAAEPATFTLFGAHFVATNDDARLLEVAALGALLERRRGAGLAENCLLVGDLNALSRHDPYPADFMEQLQAASIRKYGSPPRFDVMDRVFELGFVDTLDLPNPSRTDEPSPWVTARRGPPHARVDTRTDYVLVSANMRERGWVCGSGIVDVGDASDHHAIFALLDMGS